jgi:formate-dependent phosphoribosylglycinamide formyltransferase (GAR transformylase)
MARAARADRRGKPHLIVPEIEAIATATLVESKPMAWPRSFRPPAPPS